MSLKAVILVGGAQKGTRFRPLSLQLPKPLFPIAGVPLVEHHINQLARLPELSQIFVIGFYPVEEFTDFVARCSKQYNVDIVYLQEPEPLGTAGGVLHFADSILDGYCEGIFILNADICGDLPVADMVVDLERQPAADGLLLTTEATRDQSTNFGCVVVNGTGTVLHYVDKPTTFISTHISCGIYLLRSRLIDDLATRLKNGHTPQLWFETDIFPEMARNGSLVALHTTRWWSQTKTAGAALYANRHYLRLYREHSPSHLSTGPNIEGDVYIDATAEVHPTARIGPNVAIGAGAKIGPGVRVRESIVLPECVLDQHACVLHSVIGWRSTVGAWARVEGTPISPNPNIPFAKLDNKPMFNVDGRLNPSLTILGSDVHVSKEQIILNSVVLPYKDLTASYKNQIIM